jgi:hypothetical protein
MRCDDCHRQLDLQHPGINVAEPFRLVRVAFEVEAGDEGLVAADDHHDEQVEIITTSIRPRRSA